MIDFSKIGSGNTVDSVLSPRDIFNALPHKDTKKYQYPRDVQSQVWSKWFSQKDQRSLVIKMNTGSGKTVVGLLILKSSLNEGKGPAVYICPDNYLVKQVIGSAKELGLEVTDDVNSIRFLSGKSILVTSIHKLINGKSVFGVGDAGAKIKISSLIIDDAHACLGTIEEQFTLTIPRENEAYEEIFSIFENSLKKQCSTKAVEIKYGDRSSYQQVPYWVWKSQLDNITEIIHNSSSSDSIKFKWPLIKNSLRLCNCVISGGEIEISPHVIPMDVIPSVVEAERRIFMTATLVDDSILVSHFDVSEEDIKKPIVPDSAGDIGDRMILLPQVINPDFSDDEIKQFCKELSLEQNVVVIVPSFYRAEYWKDVADLSLSSADLHEGIEKLKDNHVGLAVLVNRYDGIDLPGNACRVLVVDGFPDVRRKIDRIEQSILSGSERNSNYIVQKIEQGMGRGIRSNDDYCVVFLIGRDLTAQLYSNGALNKLSPGTKAQLELSDQVSDQIKGKKIGSITDTISYCLSRNPDWVKASKGVLASLVYDESTSPDRFVTSLRAAYNHAAASNPVKSVHVLNDLCNAANDSKEKGYYKQVMAHYINLYDEEEAQKVQLSAASDNRRVLSPVEGIAYHRIASGLHDQALFCRDFLNNKYKDPNKLVIAVKGILENLNFKEDSSNIFEEAIRNVAKYIGFKSQRPELEFKKGPDCLWLMGDSKYLVIECKNEATTDLINKSYCNQLNGSCNWFEDKYDHTCSYTPVMIHPSNCFEYASPPNSMIRIMTKTELSRFKDAVEKFISSIASSNQLGDVEAIRKKLKQYRLNADSIVENYTVAYTVKNS